jgi:hypothetical protein
MDQRYLKYGGAQDGPTLVIAEICRALNIERLPSFNFGKNDKIWVTGEVELPTIVGNSEVVEKFLGIVQEGDRNTQQQGLLSAGNYVVNSDVLRAMKERGIETIKIVGTLEHLPYGEKVKAGIGLESIRVPVAQLGKTLYIYGPEVNSVSLAKDLWQTMNFQEIYHKD